METVATTIIIECLVTTAMTFTAIWVAIVVVNFFIDAFKG